MALVGQRGDTKVYRILADNVPNAYEEFLWTFMDEAIEEPSRNGPVFTIPYPAELSLVFPKQRVLFDIARDANPFFHVMEFIWMMSGEKKLEWIKQFNSRFDKWSDDGVTLPASYGVRWRKHWSFDQIMVAIHQLKRDPRSRRAVLTMWDPCLDLNAIGESGVDRPCNTHIYLRIAYNKLNMTVCNRSNDAIWGMLGTNAVHMTYLQELIAHGIGSEVGRYYVLTNNLHVYKNLPRFEKIMGKPGGTTDFYRTGQATTYPLLQSEETVEEFLEDCEQFVADGMGSFKCAWFSQVAMPMHDAYLQKEKRHLHISRIQAMDWRLACQQWAERRSGESQ